MKSVGVLFILIVATFGYTQAPDTLWTKVYSSPEDDLGHSILQTSDSGFIIAGSTESPGNSGIWILRTDSLGDTLWTKTYESSCGGYLERVVSIRPTTDGGYIVLDPGVILLKLDCNCDTQWTNEVEGPMIIGCDVSQTSDGGYILAGVSGMGHGFASGALTKTDSLGDTVWTRIGPFSGYGGTHSVQQTSDGKYIATGHSRDSLGQECFYLWKTDENGNDMWLKEYDIGQDNWGNCVLETADSGFITCGIFNNDIGVLRADANGDTLWITQLDHNGNNAEWGQSLVTTTDGGYIIVGSTASWGMQIARQGVFMKIGPSGDIQWTIILGGLFMPCHLNSVKQTSDNGYIAVGWADPVAYDFDLWLVKVAPDVGIAENKDAAIQHEHFTTIIFSGPLQLPEGKKCQVFDIMGRVVEADMIKPGIYFVEVDGVVTQKVVKVR